jgi:GDP/UDP-N,N'-diacetylbacillosamine 2-epimerase (hydrolysing)
MRKRRVCVVTGSRADYGLLRRLLEDIRSSEALELRLVATGAHLSPEFGLTAREIQNDGFVIDRAVEMLLSSDTPSGVAASMGLGLIGFGEALRALQPDVLLVLGDRYEILSAVAAALVARIPVAHLHGGESTEGAFDEAIRHAITKMSHLHFVAADDYRRRVIQLGESPDRVFVVGSLGIDAIASVPLLDRAELEQALDFTLGPRNLLVTFHPVTLEPASAAVHMSELLAALAPLTDTQLVFTMPNADTDGRVLFEMVEAFVESRPNARAFVSLGQRRYWSCLRHVDGVIGNSSSGVIEAPSFRTGTVNIGDRQRGRLKSQSVIDCPPERDAIRSAIDRLYDPAFKAVLATAENPYGSGGASRKIVDVIERHSLEGILKKSFYDLPADRTQVSQ